MDFENYYNNRNNQVGDIINTEKPKYVFMLESPHTDELCSNVPIAGSSGKAMTKCLCANSEVPFGLLVKRENIPINIINVCIVPLQKTKRSNQTDDILDFNMLKPVRMNYQSYGRHRKQEINDIEQFIFKKFEERICSYKFLQSTKIFLCGKFVQTYYQKYYAETETEIKNRGIKFNHPSYGGWTYPKQNDKMKEWIPIIRQDINEMMRLSYG